MITQKIEMTGRFDEAGFATWMAHRADILNVEIYIRSSNSTIFDVVASGHPILVEAFEIACSLGPTHSIIDHIDVVEMSS